jgi:hypothetical protein
MHYSPKIIINDSLIRDTTFRPFWDGHSNFERQYASSKTTIILVSIYAANIILDEIVLVNRCSRKSMPSILGVAESCIPYCYGSAVSQKVTK